MYAHNRSGEPTDCVTSDFQTDSFRTVNIFQFLGEQLPDGPLGLAGRSFSHEDQVVIGQFDVFVTPGTARQYHNLLSGLTTRGKPITRDRWGSVGAGDTTQMIFDGGLSDEGEPWLMCNYFGNVSVPYLNIVYSLGPFDLAPAEAGTYTLAVSTIFDVDFDEYCPDTTPIFAAADYIRDYFKESCRSEVLTAITNQMARSVPEVVVYPNPSSDLVHFRLPDGSRIAEVVLYDLAGREAGRGAGNGHQLTVDVSGWRLSPGVYCYRLRTEAGLNTAGRVVVQ